MKTDNSQLHQSAQLVIDELMKLKNTSNQQIVKILRRHPKPDGVLFTKSELLKFAQHMLKAGQINKDQFSTLAKLLQTKPTRTLSGVAPITVLTKPFPCPGKCIFCPSDVRMPKSYLRDEPGAQRAERNWFDPYLQTYRRLQALEAIGHSVEKAEVIVLGGTWSFYPESYQIWFITECFRALNEFSIGKDQSQQRLKKYEEISRLRLAGQHFSSSSDPEENKSLTSAYQVTGLKINSTLSTSHARSGPGSFNCGQSVPPSIPNNPNQKIDAEQIAFELSDQTQHDEKKKTEPNKSQKSYNQVVSELYVAPEKKLGLDKWQTATWVDLEEEHTINESVRIRCVGLVVETRPDNISQEEVIRIRRLGCTKVQIGVQSLQDDVLKLNHRGHDVAATRRAFKLLRQAGFKIHAHWMPNLYGSSVAKDKQDYLKLFNDPDFKPDELKIYPCSLIESAELMQYYQAGKWRPYTREELLDLLTFCLTHTPPYCRLTRVIRDIPSTDIVEGNKITNFRELVQRHIAESGLEMQDIRAREIRGVQFDVESIRLDRIDYETSVSKEVFLQFIAKETNPVDRSAKPKSAHTLTSFSNHNSEKLLGFLRLSLPTQTPYIDELQGATIIREVHVYGAVADLGTRSKDKAQHLGLGKLLIAEAKKITQTAGYENLVVISAVGTRRYYEKLTFMKEDLFQSTRHYLS